MPIGHYIEQRVRCCSKTERPVTRYTDDGNIVQLRVWRIRLDGGGGGGRLLRQRTYCSRRRGVRRPTRDHSAYLSVGVLA